jgi:hypothetical protein
MLNGWQRLGLVAFAIWFLVGGFLFWSDGRKTAGDVYGMRYGSCIRAWDTYPNINTEKFNECEARARAGLTQDLEKASQKFWDLVAIVVLVPPLVVWGLVSLVIVTVRWIRRGFAGS